jgi:hypothetical protein
MKTRIGISGRLARDDHDDSTGPDARGEPQEGGAFVLTQKGQPNNDSIGPAPQPKSRTPMPRSMPDRLTTSSVRSGKTMTRNPVASPQLRNHAARREERLLSLPAY